MCVKSDQKLEDRHLKFDGGKYLPLTRENAV